MAKKEIVRVAKLQFNAGQAKPGPALAGVGINMPEFTKAFNDATRDRGNEPVPVEITVYKDKSFDYKLFTAPASFKLLQAAKLKSGSANSKTTIVGTITSAQLRQIAEYKLPDLNTEDVEAAMKIIAGTAKNMGILVEGIDDIAKAKAEAQQAAKEAAIAQAQEEKLEQEAKAAAESKDKPIEVVTHADLEKAKKEKEAEEAK
ncbi:50S ribosomal protein L14 [Mycoplasmopsis californica]|uniref:Large ribosomal subunit protein uL11 n=1 Tax=Mycoplasmopsis equigenitalium TaxID=114883 RepID=A0ABY5J2A3_9BACT|nr:50S ribosomal protein L11 [Mycoplasmopsis equigenitalium]UUD36656.1 50S ribosomal protein L11 [Mycoplasmopsis equigenitalium]VEU69384.1 50S ribosomal protein L14 [Mycoplasmopsis californica]